MDIAFFSYSIFKLLLLLLLFCRRIPSPPLQEQANKPLDHERPNDREGQTGRRNVERPPGRFLEGEQRRDLRLNGS